MLACKEVERPNDDIGRKLLAEFLQELGDEKILSKPVAGNRFQELRLGADMDQDLNANEVAVRALSMKSRVITLALATAVALSACFSVTFCVDPTYARTGYGNWPCPISDDTSLS